MRSLDLSPPVADEVRTTTCYICACRCGIKVHLTDGRIRYIEGNPDHPVNRPSRNALLTRAALRAKSFSHIARC